MSKLSLPTYNYKIAILGYYSVGKSSLSLKYVRNQFNPNEESTIGASYLTKSMSTKDSTIQFEIWDTAGQERYNSLVSIYYKNADAALIVYDITCRDSFEAAKQWVYELNFQKPKDFLKILVGNKTDMENERRVDFEEGKEYAEQQNLIFLEASAKSGENVLKIFELFASNLPKDKYKPKKKGVKLGHSFMEYFCC